MRLQEALSRARDAFLGGGQGQALLVVAVVLLLVAVVVSAVAYIGYLMSPRGRLQSLLQQRSTSKRRANWVLRLGVPLLLLLAVAGGDWYIGRPATCARCHTDGKQATALAQSPHKGVECGDCHTPAGATGTLRAGVAYARWVWVYGTTKKVPEPKGGSVDPGACMRCHADIADVVKVRNGIRVRHKDFVGAGARCGDCHNSTAHPDAVASPSAPRMSACIACHDGVNARAECPTCHVADVAGPTPGRGFTKLTTSGAFDSCYSCHEEKPCLRCHGVSMPHPPGWGPDADGHGAGHARDGFARREVCWRCHFAKGKPFVASNESCPCHGLRGAMHGGEPWIKEHGLEATGRKTGSNARCFDCHSDTLCDLCHDPSFRASYRPIPGNDNYTRDIPPSKYDSLW
jgi:hypothetical protein